MAGAPLPLRSIPARPQSILLVGNRFGAAGARAELLAREWMASGVAVAAAGEARAIETSGADLIVIGDGADAERIVCMANAPVLIVRSPPQLPYRRIVAAVDHSPRGARALDLLPAFATAQVALIHAYHLPFRDFMAGDTLPQDPARPDAEPVLPSERLCGMPVDNRLGTPERVLSEAVEQEDYDLAVVATHGAHDIGVSSIGRTAAALLAALPCDVLMVPTAGPMPS